MQCRPRNAGGLKGQLRRPIAAGKRNRLKRRRVGPYGVFCRGRIYFEDARVQPLWIGRMDVPHSLTHSLDRFDRRRVDRSVLHDLRSCAILQASLTLSPPSSSICCIHARQGRPRRRFHSGLFSGLWHARVSTARHSAEWSGVASGSLRTWLKTESPTANPGCHVFFASLTCDRGVRDEVEPADS